MKKLYFLVLSVMIGACTQTKNDADQAANPVGGRCNLTRIGPGTILCFKFTNGSNTTTNSSQCDTYYNTTYVSILNGQQYDSGDGQNCDTSSTVGSCGISTGRMYYYNNYWNTANAQSDCTSSLTGTWSDP